MRYFAIIAIYAILYLVFRRYAILLFNIAINAILDLVLGGVLFCSNALSLGGMLFCYCYFVHNMEVRYFAIMLFCT